ncbi:MAG: quinone oxidoreductase [Noviherbaspirillum sp.]
MEHPYAINVTRLGGPEVMEAGRIAMPQAGEGQLLVEHTAIGVNFVDIYLRSGQPHSHNPVPPFIPGVNAVGRVLAIGPNVQGFMPGERVAYTNAGVGTYCTHTAVSAERAVRVPDALSDERVAAGMVRALTAQYLLKQMRPLKPGDRALVHAAAGGVGQVLVQWAKRLGLYVIATAGTDAKVALARELGADYAINYRTHDFVEEVNRHTQGAGVTVVYDSVGRDTFMGSLACLEPRGLVVNFGTASGQVEGFALQALHAKSLSVCRPTLKTYVASRADLLAMCDEAFALLADPTLRLDIAATLPLTAAAEAHRMLESRETQGSIVLIP